MSVLKIMGVCIEDHVDLVSSSNTCSVPACCLFPFYKLPIARPTACNLVNKRHVTKDIPLACPTVYKTSNAVHLPSHTNDLSSQHRT